MSLEPQAHERPEEVPVVRIDERWSSLDGHHQASVNLWLRVEGPRR